MKNNLSLRTGVATKAGLLATKLSRRMGLGEGSVIGGRVSLLLDPNTLQNLSHGRMVALVSGTNGKTTTTGLLVAAMKTIGAVANNSTGSNMFGGMVSALSGSNASVVVLEVDEGHLPKTIKATNAGFVVLLNLTRDQLDRVGEVRMQAQKWREALTDSKAIVIANSDDPLVTWAARASNSVVWVDGGCSWKYDATSCPECASRIEWTNDGWSCAGCDLKKPNSHAFLAARSQHRSGDISLPLQMKIPGEINRNNAALAITTAVMMGAHPEKAAKAVSESEGVAGRFESTKIAGIPVRLILAKNPAGWSEALRIAKPAPSPTVVGINARIQDGRDPSWLWDVPYEKLNGQFVVATGDRGRDLAVRLRYANVDHIFEPEIVEAVKIAARTAGDVEIDVIANYSAFQDFRKAATEND